MNTLLAQLEEARALQDEGLVALISAQLFYLRARANDQLLSPDGKQPLVIAKPKAGARAALLKEFKGIK